MGSAEMGGKPMIYRIKKNMEDDGSAFKAGIEQLVFELYDLAGEELQIVAGRE
jgi:hypothetical protein